VVEVWNFGDKTNPQFVRNITTHDFPTSVASKKGVVAIAINQADGAVEGKVLIGRPDEVDVVGVGLNVTVGFLPDMVSDAAACASVMPAVKQRNKLAHMPSGCHALKIALASEHFDTHACMVLSLTCTNLRIMVQVTFTPDGRTVLVANEGEQQRAGFGPEDDPEGSISCISIDRSVLGTRGFKLLTPLIYCRWTLSSAAMICALACIHIAATHFGAPSSTATDHRI
jgi:hypothetical protein